MPTASDPEIESRPRSIDVPRPLARWSQLTDAPLAGLALAREAGLILAWDDAHNIHLIDVAGRRVRTNRAPVPLNRVAISDDGSQIVAVSRDGDVWWLAPTLEPRLQQGKHRNLIGAALSPRGELLAASLSDSHTLIFDQNGRRLVNLLTTRPLKHLNFLAGQPCLVGAAEYGLVACFDLDGEPRWQDALWSSAGHVTTSGEGYAILVACYGHGIQRYALDGTNEGAYHVGGGVARVSIDFDGRLFAAATLEGELLLLNAVGHVLWRDTLPKPVKELAIDAAGEFVVYGLETGEITLLDVFPRAASGDGGTAPRTAATSPQSLAGDALTRAAADNDQSVEPPIPAKQLREPTWRVAAFDEESQAETAVLCLVPSPARVVAFSNRKLVEIYSATGERIHRSDKMTGVGRYLDCDSSAVVAATDREVLFYDVATNSSVRFPDRLTQISHLRLDGESGEIVIVEDREYLNRYDLSGRRRWVHRFDSPIESFALGADRTCAVTTEDGRLIVVDGDKRIIGEFRTAPREVLQMARLGPSWITLASKSQRVRSHQLDGSIEWEATVPTEAWRLARIGSQVAARDATGRLYLLDTRGSLLVDSTELPPESVLFVNASGEAAALYWRAGNLMVTDLVGHVRWRYMSPATLGPVAAGATGVACALGRELAFFADTS